MRFPLSTRIETFFVLGGNPILNLSATPPVYSTYHYPTVWTLDDHQRAWRREFCVFIHRRGGRTGTIVVAFFQRVFFFNLSNFRIYFECDLETRFYSSWTSDCVPLMDMSVFYGIAFPSMRITRKERERHPCSKHTRQWWTPATFDFVCLLLCVVCVVLVDDDR